MHGDESVGREMIIALAQHLVYNYHSDDRQDLKRIFFERFGTEWSTKNWEPVSIVNYTRTGSSILQGMLITLKVATKSPPL